MDGNHLIVTYTLHDQGNVIKSHALIDCSTTGYAFIDEDDAHCYHPLLHYLQLPRNLTVIDGRPITLGATTYITFMHLTIQNHQEVIPLFVTKLEHYPIALGISWL
jgi:hypothetical protein